MIAIKAAARATTHSISVLPIERAPDPQRRQNRSSPCHPRISNTCMPVWRVMAGIRKPAQQTERWLWRAGAIPQQLEMYTQPSQPMSGYGCGSDWVSGDGVRPNIGWRRRSSTASTSRSRRIRIRCRRPSSRLAAARRWGRKRRIDHPKNPVMAAGLHRKFRRPVPPCV